MSDVKKPVLIETPASVANAPTPQLTKAVPMPPLTPQPKPLREYQRRKLAREAKRVKAGS
jgi:hypothetical protein